MQEVIVLDTAVALSSTAEILEAHSIPSLVSKDMLALGLGLSLVPDAAATAAAGTDPAKMVAITTAVDASELAASSK